MGNGNFKVRCVDTCGQNHIYTHGKVYEIIDGIFAWDNGTTSDRCMKQYEKFKDLEHLNSRFMAKFEIVANESITPHLFDWEGFKSAKFAVHCDTEEKAKQFFDELKKQGVKWCSGRELTDTNWNRYKEETCYVHGNYGLEFSPREFFRIIELQVIPYVSNFREVKRPAKVGEWIKIVNAEPLESLKQYYTNGDMFQILRTNACCEEDVEVIGVESFIDFSEYVVIENYQPNEPIQEEPYKVDWSKVTNKEIAEELLRRYQED